MSRIILVSGKGGVGKTTVAAATGYASALNGHRTLVLSFDLAHSLRDSFDLDVSLFSNDRGEPVAINSHLWIQEIDVQEDLERYWSDIYRYSAGLMMGGGLDEVVAEEIAIMPGMEDIVALMRLNGYVQSGAYDVIVLDCPPTSEALRFVSFSSTLDWYVRKRLKTDRNLLKLVRPMAKMMTDAADRYIPDDSYFSAIQRLFDKLNGVEKLLLDPKVTTVRLVTNPEKMVVRETQRAFMYFCMYGMAIDEVVINRLLPEGEGYFSEWAKSQALYSRDIREYFDPVPVSSLPLLPREVVGLSQLETFAGMLYGDRDPAAVFVDLPAYGFSKSKDGSYVLKLRVPFAPKDKVDLSRKQEDLVVRIGTFKRNILLPRSIATLATVGASMRDGMLEVQFAKEATNVE